MGRLMPDLRAGCGGYAPPLLEVCGVSLRRGGRLVLKDIDLEMHGGQCFSLCGVSGSGKTSLLRAVAGLDPVSGGLIRLDGRVRNRPGRADCGRGEVGMVFQGEQLYRHLSLLDNVTLAPRKVHGVPKMQAEEEAMRLLGSVGLEALAKRYPWQMSGGERQRGAIARAMALRPRLMLFDEPTSSLDPSCARAVLDAILALRSGGQAMIVVTHDLAFARAVADDMLIMESGTVCGRMSPESFSCGPENAMAGRIFGEKLFDVSSADRLRLGNSLVAAVPDGEDPALAERHRLVRLMRARGHEVSFRRIKREDAALCVRLHLADCVFFPGKEPVPDGLVRVGPETEGLAVLAAGGDVLWLKTLVSVLGKDT